MRKSLVAMVALAITTLASRFFGFIREMLQARFLGTGLVADAFVVALSIPQSLRKIFAEGALSAAFVPTIVAVKARDGSEQAQRVALLTMLCATALLGLLCFTIAQHTHGFVRIIAPGWAILSPLSPQIVLTAQLLAVLIYLIALYSLTSLFAGVLQAAGKFNVTAWVQIGANILMIGQMIICIAAGYSVVTLARLFVFNAVMSFFAHLLYARRIHAMHWLLPNRAAWQSVGEIFAKFVPCLLSAGALEVSTYIDGMFASYLPLGNRALLSYASAFARMPLGVVLSAYITVSLPRLTLLQQRAPKRLSWFLFESTKLMWFIMLPISLVLWALGPTIISTLLGAKFSPEASVKAGYTMAIIGSGLFFSALNRTCSMILHARNQTFLPSVTALIATIINTLGNALLLKPFGLYGLAAATTFSSCSQTVMLLLLLMYTCQVGLPLRRLFDFFSRTGLIMAALGLCWWASMQMVWYVIAAYSSQATCLWLLHSPAYWLFALPIALGCCFVYLITRRRLGVRIFLFE